ncbi:MAG: phosphoenolpyruvate carboxykinase (ATP) [Bryobacterales bacterium]|nr:phosphoenolpyruvate carboxykinase (ATP) [Bryobacterales bacterium]
MHNVGNHPSHFGLREHGIRNLAAAYWNLSPAQLIEKALKHQEGILAANGALSVRTGQFTGRSPKDKFIVKQAETESTVDWGAVNQPMTEAHFDRLHSHVLSFLQGRDVYIQDCFGGGDESYTLPIRVITRRAWHSLFARQLFVRPAAGATASHVPEFTLLFVPDYQADPETDGSKSETCIAINFRKRVVIIAGTEYAGEMKKSVFSILNYILPDRGVFPMHCSANVGEDGDVALFFGLSGTGKTTLSADPRRRLIGDDEHGWSDQGVFNFEGGCYAKCIRLSREKEPQIWNAIRFGSVLENVVVDENTRICDFDAETITENTRAAYPVEFIDNAVIPGVGGLPSRILFLTADAFGVLPPIARLTPEQAMYHFLSGYTAKVAGTERGLGSEPQATFSACFGAPFLPRPAITYAQMLGERLARHKVSCWLVNTGWVGGAFGTGRRMSLPYTRAMVTAVIEGGLRDAAVEQHPVFQTLVPKSCPGVPAELLDARRQWKDAQAYDRAAAELSTRFRKNFAKFGAMSREILMAAPVG